MRKRRKFVILASVTGLVALAGVFAILWLIPSRPEVSLTTVVRVKPGMSEAAVAAILGPPTADVTTVRMGIVPPPPDGCRLLEYADELATARVVFDADDRVVGCQSTIHTITGLERLRLRLNW
jgi:hypothetical protein